MVVIALDRDPIGVGSAALVGRDIVTLGVLRIAAVRLDAPGELAHTGLPALAVRRERRAERRTDGDIRRPNDIDALAVDPRRTSAPVPIGSGDWYVVSSTCRLRWHDAIVTRGPVRSLLPALVALCDAAVTSSAAPRSVPPHHLEAAIRHVLDALFVEAGPHPSSLDEGGSEAAALRGRARAAIDRAFADPELSSAAVALALNVSLRTLQRAYAEAGDGVTVSDDIARRRREHAERLLVRCGSERVPLDAVARASGYPRQAGLRRAFLTEFGMSPSAYRAWRLAPAGAHDAHAAQDARLTSGRAAENPRIEPHSKDSRSRREPGPRVPERPGVTSGRADNPR